MICLKKGNLSFNAIALKVFTFSLICLACLALYAQSNPFVLNLEPFKNQTSKFENFVCPVPMNSKFCVPFDDKNTCDNNSKNVSNQGSNITGWGWWPKPINADCT